MKRLLRIPALIAIFCVALSSCSAPLVPAARMSELSRTEASDELILQQLHQYWKTLQKEKLSPEERGLAIEQYNGLLLQFMQRIRFDSHHCLKKGTQYSPRGFDFLYMGKVLEQGHLVGLFDDVVPAADVKVRDLEEHYSVRGLGVPMVGVIPVNKLGRDVPRHNIAKRGAVSTLTIVMRFTPQGRAQLEFIPRQRQEYTTVGRMNYELAADFSTSIDVYWNLTQVKKDRFLGLLKPQELRDITGLSCIERYNPDKIPVILIHGLASSASTYNQLVNRLLSEPTIRSQYQFWYYSYPTGLAWTLTAKQLRDSLAALRLQVDPEHKNDNWDKLVLVGHSMGGLITHYNQCEEPWRVLEGSVKGKASQYLKPEYVNKEIPVAEFDALREVYFFEPVKAGMVVYLATPHKGAPMADYRIVEFFHKLIKLPQNLVEEAVNLVTLQQDTVLLQPQQIYQWFTSINQLSPSSYSIVGLKGLKVRDVPTHSIIGDRGRGNTPRSSDGVVPYWSSHITWGSEAIVPSGHSVQDIPETADVMKEILLDYLKKHPQKKRATPQRYVRFPRE